MNRKRKITKLKNQKSLIKTAPILISWESHQTLPINKLNLLIWKWSKSTILT